MGSNMDKIYIVMNYVEHDLKSLMETMKQPFLPGRGSTQGQCWGTHRARGGCCSTCVEHVSALLPRRGEDADDPAAAWGQTPARQLDPTPRPQDVQPAPEPRWHPQGGRLWAGSRVWLPSEGLHPSCRDPVVPRPRATARCQGEYLLQDWGRRRAFPT